MYFENSFKKKFHIYNNIILLYENIVAIFK